MATTTRVLTASVNGTVYTTNANGALEAIDTCHSGATAPTDEVANGKLWLDTTTTPGILKMYNNATWEVVLTATGTSQVKLDAIEALADVTDATNVTAAGALMDSELTSIASVKALNQGVATTDSPTFVEVTASGITVDNTNPAITSADADGFLIVSGGTTGALGGNIRLFGPTHATTANDILFRGGSTGQLRYDDSASLWNFQANDITTTGTVTATDFAGDGSALTGVVIDTTAAAVGTYMLCRAVHATTAKTFTYNTSYAGSGLYPGGASAFAGNVGTGSTWNSSGFGMANGASTSSALTGTWRCMGQTHPTYENPLTLFVRIS